MAYALRLFFGDELKDHLSINSHREYLFNYLKKKFQKSRKEDLEDIVQDTIIKAVRHSHSWKGDCSLKTWLSVIARNMYLDRMRKNYIKNDYLLSSPNENYIFEQAFIEDFSSDIIDHSNQNELLSKLFFDSNNNIHVNAFKLSVIDELDYKCISEEYNIPIGTVKSRIFRGRQILLERYNQIKESE